MWICSPHLAILYRHILQCQYYLFKIAWLCSIQSSLVYSSICSYLFFAIEDIPWVLNGAKALEPFFSLWNLDLFRSIFPNICLDVDTLTVFALEACVALYLFVLMIISYCLIELYGRNIRCVVVIWRPFRSVFHLFRENWDIRTSVIDSFATFFLLSYVKS